MGLGIVYIGKGSTMNALSNGVDQQHSVNCALMAVHTKVAQISVV